MTILGVTGMTCNHCVRHVEEALRALPGVSAVEVDLSAGRATVTHDVRIATPQLVAAIEAAGYEATPTG